MSAIPLMARYLEEELQARGIASLSHADCAEILRVVIDRTAKCAEKVVAELDRSPEQ
jgi:hypothetical protein